jgi:hypothetical protein
MGAFAGMREAKMYEKGVFLSPITLDNGPGNPVSYRDAHFELEIEKCILKDCRGIGLCFIVELRVLASDHKLHTVGDKRTWLQKMTDKDVAFGALKQFAAAATGTSPSDKEGIKKLEPEVEGLMDAACGEQNILKGSRVKCTVVNKKTKAKNQDFSVHNWEPLAPEGK